MTLDRDVVASYYEAKDPVGGADVTLVVTGQRPQFATAAGQVSEVSQRVRGHVATLRRVAVSPAAQITVYWQESATQWVQLQTDDTFTDTEVLRFAEGLVAANVAVVAPFRVDRAPTGMVVESQTPWLMAFRPAQAAAGSVPAVTCTLVSARPLVGQSVAVGADRGTVTHSGSGVTLAVLLASWQMTLLVEVPAKQTVADADLVRFAEGLHVTERAEPMPSASGGTGATK